MDYFAVYRPTKPVRHYPDRLSRIEMVSAKVGPGDHSKKRGRNRKAIRVGQLDTKYYGTKPDFSHFVG
jgi:hypothetical protein